MQRPDDLFDRLTEWSDLVHFASTFSRGIRLGVVWGRRRQGKSFLLRRIAKAQQGFYYQGLTQSRSQALADFGTAVGKYTRSPGAIRFENWDDAFSALIKRSKKNLIVIDELPYLLKHSPELPSVLQRHIDTAKDENYSCNIIVCGSAISVMAKLLSGEEALRGRATLDLVVKSFDFRTAAQFWKIKDPKSAFLVHAIVGGTPGYKDLLEIDPLKKSTDIGDWLAKGVLNPSSALFREDDYLLAEEPTITERTLYRSVLTAVAQGRTSQGAIASEVGREQRAIQHPLRVLVNAGFITQNDDVLRSKRPIYSLSDPIIRFHHVVTRGDIARFEERDTKKAWEDATHRFSTHVLGPHFENVARVFVSKFASESTVGARLLQVGTAVVNNKESRTSNELDVVGLSRTATGSSHVAVLGEAKATTKKRTLSDVVRLDQIRTNLSDKHKVSDTCRLLLFSLSGFEKAVHEAARGRKDLELIDLERLYHGE